ncbi:hypothetical protein BJV82DRAFT_145681 [Fennellomyces sp. T-0311]|nr:hypothetical protein BJV82DRAFT_145681 [Fennellomyces sp. T-0311]
MNELSNTQATTPAISTTVRRKRSRSPSMTTPLVDDRPFVKARTDEPAPHVPDLALLPTFFTSLVPSLSQGEEAQSDTQKADIVDSPRPSLRVHIQRNHQQKHQPLKQLPASSSTVATSSPGPPVTAGFSVQESSDPMRRRLDGMGIKRLTVAILRRLSVVLSVDELPSVDLDDPRETDSQQILPLHAMQIITTMILGTSGDKDVSQTDGSQISNGDLVAVQRMVIEGLRVKNISINTLVAKRLVTANSIPEQPMSMATPGSAQLYIDLSTVKYEPPTNVTRLFLRLYRFILNMLLATPDCWPFIQPVPDSAVLYHQEIKNPMDLSTVEKKAWDGAYTTFSKFEKDMLLIWQNAKSYHSDTGTIPKHADKLHSLFRKIVLDLKTQIRPQKNQKSAPSSDFRFDPIDLLPEETELSQSLLSRLFSANSTVYTIAAMSPLEPKAKQRGLASEKLLYLQLNGPFFEAVERMKKDPTADHRTVPRFYIAKNRTFLEQVSAFGVLAIFYNTKVKRIRPKRYQVETDILITYPASSLYDIDRLSKDTHELAPKAWIHLRPLRIVENASFEVNETVERDYFRRMYTTARITAVSQPLMGGSADDVETKLMLRRIARTALSLPDSEEEDNKAIVQVQVKGDKKGSKFPQQVKPSTPLIKKEGKTNGNGKTGPKPVLIKSEERSKSPSAEPEAQVVSEKRPGKMRREADHEVWRRLFEVCRAKGVDIQNLSEKYGSLNWSNPNSEGFFKQVYFLQDVVVQAFRQMTMYQRITEIACLMKLRNLPHMAQMKEIIYNDDGDVMGLTMERYQETLKQYTHVHSHHRLTAHQKYSIIRQMIRCIKTIHEAGLAHRDLSEVNFMVNRVDDKLDDGSEDVHLYLIDFGKSVFCEAQDVRDWFVDVPRAKWEYDGDVVPESKEELEIWCANLPWVKGKPDHGYRISIQTLPKTRSDTQVLPWLIHPMAEDIYSIGVMIWKTFTDTEPWRGVLDTDLQGLRYVAEDDYRIERALQQDINGVVSRELLLKCLRTAPLDRVSAAELSEWFELDETKAALLEEWKTYSSETRATRKAKTVFGFEEMEDESKRRRKRKPNQANSTTTNFNNKGKGRSTASATAKAKTPSPHPPHPLTDGSAHQNPVI